MTVPGYHLGFELQQKAVGSGYDSEQEQALMRSISWPEVGYRLFDISCFSGSCAHGFYLPHSESNCISMPREIWKALGGYDARFNMRGGGVVISIFTKGPVNIQVSPMFFYMAKEHFINFMEE